MPADRNLIADDAYPYTFPSGIKFEKLSHHMAMLNRFQADLIGEVHRRSEAMRDPLNTLCGSIQFQDVARQLGHTVATCLHTYSHYVGQGQRRAANALGQVLRHRFGADGTEIGTRDAR